jgi:PAS domain S-box-containing protein
MTSNDYPFLHGGGLLADIIAAFDWSATSLGPISGWPQWRQTAVALILRSPVPLVTLWGEDGVMIYNDAYSEFAGGRHPQLLGSKVREGWPEVADFNDNVMKVGLAGGTLAYRDQELTLFRSGVAEQVWMNLDYSPLLDDQGRPAGVMAIVVETSAKVQAESQMRSSEATFRTLAQSIPNQVWASNADGNVNWYNDRVYEYAGVTPGELDDSGWAAIVHPEDVVRASQDWITSVATGKVYETEFRIRRADGSYRWHIVRALPIHGQDGATLRWVGTNTDIEDQKSAANILLHMNEILEREVMQRTAERDRTTLALQQSQKMEAIGKLTGGVAHDFNNLLQVISGNLQLLYGDVAGNERAERRLDNALAGVTRGAKLASYLLAFGRRQALDPRVVRIGRFISGMEDMLRHSLGEEIEIDTRIATDLWNTLVDTVQVENAVLNLCINARDAMKGSGKLLIEVSNTVLDECCGTHPPDVAAGQYVMIAVSDTGCGMTPEVQEQAFDPFFSTKPEGKGSGLGLSMVYGFAKQSGGSVKIDSMVDEGTTVRLYLPRTLAEEESYPAPEHFAVVGGAETVLVVEDDDGVRATVVDLMSELGYRVLKASDPASALAIIDSGEAVDLLFTDVVMPGSLRSPELARRARERLPSLAVLYTSGYTESAIVHGGRLDAGVELLSKPYTRETLARKIRHVLANQKQRGQLRQPVAATTPDVAAPIGGGSGASGHDASAGARILLVEDDDELRSTTAELLELLGHTVVQAGEGNRALQLLDGTQVDVMITDISLPGMSGEVLAQRARELRPGLRVVFAAGQQPRASLDNSAVLLKPFSVEKLMAALAGGVH